MPMIEITKEALDVLQEVAYCIATENADPVHILCEATSDRPTLTTADGFKLGTCPVVDLGTLEAFFGVVSHIEDAFHKETTDV